MHEKTKEFAVSGTNPLVLGQRIRHFRRKAHLTLDELGRAVGRQASYLSQLENGKHEPRLSILNELALALGCTLSELLEATPPDSRSALELRVLEIQESPRYAELQLPLLRPTARTEDIALQHLITMFDQLSAVSKDDTAGNSSFNSKDVDQQICREMQRRNNYFPEIEEIAERTIRSPNFGLTTSIWDRSFRDIASIFGFSVERVRDLPTSTRAITDERRKVIYIAERNELPTRKARIIVAQTLGHYALGHSEPSSLAEYSRQRFEENYFAGALLAPQNAVMALVTHLREARDISIEDLHDKFHISVEMAAYRLTNLITERFDIPVHFLLTDREGVAWKTYANDDLPLPSEGQRVCAKWGARKIFVEADDTYRTHHQFTKTPEGTYWCATYINPRDPSDGVVTIGVGARDARWFRGHKTEIVAESNCPDPSCCHRVPSEVAIRLAGRTWASPKDQSHSISGLPAGAEQLPLTSRDDRNDVYNFLYRRSSASPNSGPATPEIW